MTTKFLAAFALASVVATSAFADGNTPQSNPPVIAATQSSGLTRAQVRGELVALEKAGYSHTGEDTDYPVGVQAAEARVAQNSATAVAAATTTVAQDHAVKKFSFIHMIHSLPQQTAADYTKSIYFGG
jgi:hypothetical protein